MQDSVLAQDVRELIANLIPDLDALELLVFLAGAPGRDWSPEDLQAELPHLNRAALGKSLSLFAERQLAGWREGRYRFDPGTPALAAAVAGLCKAYQERPVTLVRTLYAIADERRIQSFADAFRLKKPEP